MSYKLKEVTRGSFLSKRERGCPMPPPAPRTATLVRQDGVVEKDLTAGAAERRIERANMMERGQGTVRSRVRTPEVYRIYREK